MRLINADALLKALGMWTECRGCTHSDGKGGCVMSLEFQACCGAINATPTSAIDRAYCENALLFLWMEDVLTDGEYNRIMDKLKKSLI